MPKRTIERVSSKQSCSKNITIASADDQMAVDVPVDTLSLFRQRILTLLNELENTQMDICQALADNLDAIKSNIQKAYNLHALYTHLAMAIAKDKYPLELKEKFKQLINTPEFVRALYVELNKVDKFHNPVEASVFETYLAQLILKASSTDILLKINQKIMTYCQDHKQSLLLNKANILKAELIKYHLCAEEEFRSNNPVDKFIQLLDRPLNNENNIVESITLHLIFFNYNHIFDTTLLSDDPAKQAEFASNRADFHNWVRPKENGGMFSHEIRGRISVYDAHCTREFGIADPADLPLILQSWHRNEFTPCKYRAKANQASPIVKIFRSHRIPFIAGPSGTTADCIEGTEFLFYDTPLSDRDISNYVVLIASAEIALGCHSFFEVILPAFNLRNKPLNQTDWEWISNNDTYSCRLSTQLKDSSEYIDLTSAFPQFFGDKNSDILSAYAHIHKQCASSSQYIQRYIRANQSYTLLDHGVYWHQSNNGGQTKINHAQFRMLSKANVSRLRKALSSLDDKEICLVDKMLQASVEITHYTHKASDILHSRFIYSLHYMLRNSYKNGDNHSYVDVASLSNHGNVFFRYELIHQYDKPSRFGSGQFIFGADSTALFQRGWVSLFEMLNPFSSSVASQVCHRGKVARQKINYKTFYYPFSRARHALDLYQTLFYGPDIKIGLALCVLRELRRIGGSFRDEMLADTSLSSMSKLLSMLFRVEAKIPGLVSLDHSTYQYAEPISMCTAVTANDLKKIDEILSRGMRIDAPISTNESALMYAASLSGDQCYDAFVHLHNKGAALRDGSGSGSVPFALVTNKNIRCLAYLLENGLDLQMRDHELGPSLIEAIMLQQWRGAKLSLSVFKGDRERVFLLIADFINSITDPNVAALYLSKIKSDDHVFSLYLARPQSPVQGASLFSTSLESYTYKQKLLARCGAKPAVPEPESMSLRY